jgi:hypothetical protein
VVRFVHLSGSTLIEYRCIAIVATSPSRRGRHGRLSSSSCALDQKADDDNNTTLSSSASARYELLSDGWTGYIKSTDLLNVSRNSITTTDSVTLSVQPGNVHNTNQSW